MQVATFLGYIQQARVPDPVAARKQQQQGRGGASTGGDSEPAFLSPGPHLIVAPASILGNWQRELAAWAPRLRVGVYRGGPTRFRQMHTLQTGPLPGAASAAPAKAAAAAASAAIDVDGSVEGSDSDAAVDVDGGDEASEAGDSDAPDEDDDGEDGEEDDEEDGDYGAGPASKAKRGGSGSGGDGPARAFDVLLVTYTMFDKQSAGANQDRGFLRRYRWDTVTCDEGHAIRDETRNRHKYLRALHARTRLLLSGTPVQNTVGELFALLRFVMPTVFRRGAQSIFEEAVRSAEEAGAGRPRLGIAAAAAGHNGPSSSAAAAGGDALPFDQSLLAQLRRVLTPFMLRRSKAEVLGSLPAKTDTVVLVGPTPTQSAVYTALIEDARARLVGETTAGQTRALIAGGVEMLDASLVQEEEDELALMMAAEQPRKRRAAIKAEAGIAAGNALTGGSVAASQARAAARASAPPAGAGGKLKKIGKGKAASAAGADIRSLFGASSGAGSASSGSAESAVVDVSTPRAASRGGAGDVIIIDSPFDVETTPGGPAPRPADTLRMLAGQLRGASASAAAVAANSSGSQGTGGAGATTSGLPGSGSGSAGGVFRLTESEDVIIDVDASRDGVSLGVTASAPAPAQASAAHSDASAPAAASRPTREETVIASANAARDSVGALAAATSATAAAAADVADALADEPAVAAAVYRSPSRKRRREDGADSGEAPMLSTPSGATRGTLAPAAAGEGAGALDESGLASPASARIVDTPAAVAGDGDGNGDGDLAGIGAHPISAPRASAAVAWQPRRASLSLPAVTPYSVERTAGNVAEPGSGEPDAGASGAPSGADAAGGSAAGGVQRMLDLASAGASGAGGAGGDDDVTMVDAPAPAPSSSSSSAPALAAPPRSKPIDPVLAERLRRAVSKAPKRAVGNMFFDLRKAASHPLLLRTRYTHEPTLRRLAEALKNAGAFGTAKTLTTERALEELRGYSDLQIHSMCAQYGCGRYDMVDDLPGGVPPASSPSSSGGGAGAAAASSAGGSAPSAPSTVIVAPAGVSDRALLRACRLPLSSVLAGSKALWLAERLPALLAEGHRVLIFSVWTSVLDILEVLIGQALGLGYIRLDGSTKVEDRQGLIDAFQAPDSEHRIFLLSTKAGGLGLTLTAADTVVVHDLSFNPQDDAQAVDRAHRLGQTRPVTVMRLVTAGTVDEGVYRLAASKTALDVAIKGGEGAGGGDSGGVPASSIGELLAKALA